MRRIMLAAGLAVVIGCGKKPDDPPATKAAKVEPAKPKESPPTTASRPTYTRKQLEAMLTTDMNAASVKAKFGPPDRTMKVPARTRGQQYLQYQYERLSVDADGSGKTDAVVLINLSEHEPHECLNVQFLP